MTVFWQSPSEEFEFIRYLFCRWFNPEKADFDSERFSRLDWQKVYELLEQHRLWVAVEEFLGTEYGSVVPPEYVEKIRETHKLSCINNLRILRDLISLGKLMDAARIPYAVIKGPLLSASIYGDINKRFSRDIDILVSDSDLQRVHELLIRNEYTPLKEEGDIHNSRFFQIREMHRVYLFRSRSKVEIHSRLDENPCVLDLRNIDPWKIYKEQEFFGHRFRVFQDDFMFIYLCVHGSKHFWFRLFWLADICALRSSRSPEQLDDILRLADRYGFKRAVCSALRFADYFTENPVPENFNKDLVRFGNIYFPSWMDESYLLSSQATLYERFRLLLSFRLARSYFLGGFKIWSRELIHALFVPTRTDFQNLKLPESLQFLYVVLRPFLILKRILLR